MRERKQREGSQKKESRREALKRMAKLGVGITGLAIFPGNAVKTVNVGYESHTSYGSYSSYSSHRSHSSYESHKSYSSHKSYNDYSSYYSYSPGNQGFNRF